MFEIDPAHSFPNERALPDHWNSSLTGMQEHELEHRWAPSARYSETTYSAWAQNHPTEAKAWADGELASMRSARESALSDWLRTMDIQKRTGTTITQATFKNSDASAAFGQLQYIGSQYSLVPDRTQPQTDAVVAEARRSTSDPSQFIDSLNARLKQADIRTRLDMNSVMKPLDDLSASLKSWSDALAKEPAPGADTLAKLAEDCRAKFEAAQHAAIDFTPTPAVKADDAVFINKVVRECVEVMAGVVADQLVSRAGDPSFLNLFKRLTEQPHGTVVDPQVKQSINDASGDYRSVWSDGRDNLIDAIKDPAERSAVKKALAASKLDLGPNLSKWRDQFKSLSKGTYDLRDMRDAILNVTFAGEQYRSIIEGVVKQPDVLDGFKKLLDGIQLSISHDVAFCTESV